MRRNTAIAVFLLVAVLFIWHSTPNLGSLQSAWSPDLTTTSSNNEPADHNPPLKNLIPSNRFALSTNVKHARAKHVQKYFEQVFTDAKPYEFSTLRQVCAQAPAPRAYIQCRGIAAGLTTIMSQLKGCFKMAAETGSNLILPRIPIRSATDITNFQFWNKDAYLDYDEWFDLDHLLASFKSACPRIDILPYPRKMYPNTIPDEWWGVPNFRMVNVTSAPGFEDFSSYFWPGRPFKPYFDNELAELEKRIEKQDDMRIMCVDAQFLVFRVTDDPTRHDLRLWNDLSHLLRFRDTPRKIVGQVLSQMKRPFYGVHFRAETDSLWSSPDHQMEIDLDALDQAWASYGRSKAGGQKPLVYLACGDQGQVERFVALGKTRGWEVTHKWALAQGNPETLKLIDELPFDFQGAVDMGVMVKAEFFLGIIGSAFSSTIANARDPTGRYRGSSFMFEDEGARTHLFNDGDAKLYGCCL